MPRIDLRPTAIAVQRRLYFAYGSNLDAAQMSLRCPDADPVRPLVLNNWQLAFRGVADIEAKTGSTIYGGLYAVSDDDEDLLDMYEGVSSGKYRKLNFRIRDTDEVAFFYKMRAATQAPPTKAYYNTILRGYDMWSLPKGSLFAARQQAQQQIQQQAMLVPRPIRVKEGRGVYEDIDNHNVASYNDGY